MPLLSSAKKFFLPGRNLNRLRKGGKARFRGGIHALAMTVKSGSGIYRSFESFYYFRLDPFDGHFLIMKLFRQEGLLLTYPSPNPMLIDETVQEIFMAHGPATAETRQLSENFGNFLGDLITLPILAGNGVWVEGLG